MSAASPANLRSLYRSILRELPSRPIASPRSPLHRRLRESFTATAPPAAASPSASSAGPETHDGRTALAAAAAEQFVTYLRSQRTYVALLDRYNPGMNMDQGERVRLSARRVGMDLPQEFTAEGEGDGEKK